MRASYVAPEEGLARIARVISQHTGIELNAEALAALERKLQKRITGLGMSNLVDYAKFLEQLPSAHPDIQHAIEQATIKETYFWREDLQIAAWMDEAFGVVPPGYQPMMKKSGEATRERRENPQRFTIWSAGCSSGEEVYTIAMMLAEAGVLSKSQVRLLGTDVSRKAIETARRGVYGPGAFRAIPDDIHARYFDDTPEGAMVTEEIRDLCRFQMANMLHDGTPLFGLVNAIFCRNVLIYFGEASRHAALTRFYDMLLPGGILCLGHSESLLHMKTPFEALSTAAGILYVKRGPGRSKR